MDKVQKKSKKKFYFTLETQKAIVKYNNCTDEYEKNKIFDKYIKNAFDKMAENIINRFRFQYFDIPIADVKSDVVTMLVMKMHNYTEEKGKAFSYFSIVSKNYLIRANNTNYKKFKNNVKLYEKKDDYNNENNELLEINNTNEHNLIEIHRKDEIKEFTFLFVNSIEKQINTIFKKERDIKICHAILELLKRADSIENFNKKALYILIREMTGLDTKYVTKVTHKLKIYYKQLYKKYLDEGYI